MRNKVILAILAASTGWGLAGVGTRASYGLGATTASVLTVRTVVAGITITVWALATRTLPSRTAWAHGSLIGVLRTGLTPLLFMTSLNYISAGVEGLVITLIPATTAAMAAVMLRETITRRQVLGLIAGLVGTTVIVIAGDSGLESGGDVVLGYVFGGAAVITGSFSGILQRKYAPLHDTVPLAMPMFITGAAVSTVAGLIIGFDTFSTYSTNLWALLVTLAIASTLLPFAATLYASRHASATIVAITGYLAPIVAVIGGVVLLDEVITPAISLGAAITLVGVALVGRGRRTTT